jgi:hypothetical protein
MFDKLTGQEAMDFVKKIEDPFKSLPHLPKGLVEFFVKIAPWLAIIGAVLGLVAGPLVGILGGIGSLFSLSPIFLIWTVATVVFTLLNSVLLFMAFKPLKEREMKGWMLLFWSNIIGIVEGVLGLLINQSSIVGTLLGIVIGLYILFEMKPLYDGVMDGEVVEKITKKK